MKNKKVIASSILSLMTITLLFPKVNAVDLVKLKSQYYKVDNENNIITRIEPKTEVEDFKQKFYLENNEDIKLYLNDSKEVEIDFGLVGTGMVLKYTDANGQSKDYVISVIGDLNNDGIMNQIELGNIIRHVIGIENATLTGIQYTSADITDDGLVDQRDVTKIIQYITTERLDVDVPDIEAPIINIEAKEKDTDKIVVQVSATDEGRGMDENPNYDFYIKKDSESSYIKIQSGENAICTFDGLTADTDYNIKVVTEDKCGNAGEKIITEKTEKMPELNILLAVEDYNVKAVVSNKDDTKDLSNIVSYKYSIKESLSDDSTYFDEEETTSNECVFTNLVEGRSYTIKVEVKDGANNSTIKTEDIVVMDNVPPQVELNIVEQTSNSISIQVSTADVGGMPETTIYQYYIKQSNDENYILKKETSNETYTYTNLTQDTEYVIKVETKDKALNVGSKELNVKTDKVKDLDDENAAITLSSNVWTNENIVATVNVQNESYIIQTSKDGINWENSSSQIFTTNGTMYARLIDTSGQEGTKISKDVTFIDKLEPVGSMSLTNTTKSINIVVTANDVDATGENGKSGIKGYYYSKDDGITYTEIQTNNSYEFTNLTQTTDYKIRVKIEDNAGNIKEISEINQTQTIPTGTITISDVAWNTDTHKASVRISTTASGYMLQYSSDNPNWININNGNKTEEYEVGTTIYARLWDGYNESADIYASLKITDNLKPNEPTFQIIGGTLGNEEWYTSDVSVKVTAGADNQSGVRKVTYTLSGGATLPETELPSDGIVNITENGIIALTAYTYDNAGNKSLARTITIKKDSNIPTIMDSTLANTSTIIINAKDSTSGIVGYAITENTNIPTTFVNLDNVKNLNVTANSKEQGKDYYIWVKDEAGNISNYKKVTTQTIPTGTVTIDNIAWNTNTDKASVTVSTTAVGFILQYSVDKVHWITITSGNKTAEYAVNTTIYARLFDGYNESSDTYASIKITETDRP